jgi:hypothetical protein
MQPTEPNIQLRWRNRTLLDHDTEENGNNDKYHRPGYENGCNNLSEAGSPHIRRSVALIMVYNFQDDLLAWWFRARSSSTAWAPFRE